MPKYVEADLQKFHHPTPMKPQYSPHLWNRPIYGAATQCVDPEDNSEPITPEGITMIRKIEGTLLYYALALYSTMLVALSDIAATQSKATEKTYDDVVWLLNYAASHPTAVVQYKPSKMIMRVQSDASYLSVTKVRSRAGRYHYLSNYSEDPPDNDPIQNLCKNMTNVMALEAEA